MLKTSREALNEFDEAAQEWGWQQDTGYGSAVGRAERYYFEARVALEKRINHLEQTARDLRKKLKEQNQRHSQQLSQNQRDLESRLK